MGPADPRLRIISSSLIRRVAGTSEGPVSPAAWQTAEKIGLVRPADRGRELYCLLDAYRLTLSEELRRLGLDARGLAALGPAILAVDWTFEGGGVALYSAGPLRLLVEVDRLAAEVNEALTCLSVTLAAAPPQET